MQKNTDRQTAGSEQKPQSPSARPRWSTPPAAAPYRPSLSFASMAKSRQKPLGPMWVGLMQR